MKKRLILKNDAGGAGVYGEIGTGLDGEVDPDTKEGDIVGASDFLDNGIFCFLELPLYRRKEVPFFEWNVSYKRPGTNMEKKDGCAVSQIVEKTGPFLVDRTIAKKETKRNGKHEQELMGHACEITILYGG